MAQHRIAWLSLLLFALPGCPDSHGAGDAGTDAPPGDVPVFYYDACSCDVSSDAPPVDAPLVFTCEADDAHQITCPSGICDGLDSYAWDGERCIRIDCGTCEGTDCETLAHSETECIARHAICVPYLCTSTGGDWLFWAEECEYYDCGMLQPVACLVGQPVCNCGYERSFVPGVGCAPDTCPEYDPLPPDTLCASTGGTWTLGICCPTTCGVHCDLDCVAPACACGPMQIFDSIRGCIDATECYVRAAGETCTNNHTRCDDGLLCCQHCTGVGCSPDLTCEVPLCDGNPDVDECGNNLLAP